MPPRGAARARSGRRNHPILPEERAASAPRRDHIRDEDAAGNHRSERQVERGTGLLGLPLVILLESGDGRETNRGDGAGDCAGPGIPGRRSRRAARSERKFEISGVPRRGGDVVGRT